MNKYKPSDLSPMRVNPFMDGDIFDAYPQLNDIDWGVIETDRDRYVRFVSLCYDPCSPLIKTIPDVTQRKPLAMIEVQYTGEMHYGIIVQYLVKIIKDKDYAYLVTLEHNFAECLDVLNAPLELTDQDKLVKTVELKGKLRDQADAMRRQIPLLWKDFYAGDEEMMESDISIEYSPESIGKKTKRR